MIDKEKITDLQNRIVSSLASIMPNKSGYIFVHFERDFVAGEHIGDAIQKVFLQRKGKWVQVDSEPYGFETQVLFIKLCEAMLDEPDGYWGSCLLEADSSGRYRFSFSYDEPKRMRGIENDETLFKNYLPRPLGKS